uniref:Uncharacterized protein n=1 Tax=Anguilla anguilla TaxID=7936 RepID=A0A0E9W8G6_ANGAN
MRQSTQRRFLCTAQDPVAKNHFEKHLALHLPSILTGPT